MNLIQYEPGTAWSRPQEDIDNLFESTGPLRPWPTEEGSSVPPHNELPSVDTQEKPDQFLIRADIPGVKPDDAEVNMENGVLSIRGERKSEERKEEKGYRRVECSYGVFHRRFTLPETADAEKNRGPGQKTACWKSPSANVREQRRKPLKWSIELQ